MTSTLRWRRSSLSINGSSCVELAHTRDAVHDSKNPTILLPVPTLTTLIKSVRENRFDR